MCLVSHQLCLHQLLLEDLKRFITCWGSTQEAAWNPCYARIVFSNVPFLGNDHLLSVYQVFIMWSAFKRHTNYFTNDQLDELCAIGVITQINGKTEAEGHEMLCLRSYPISYLSWYNCTTKCLLLVSPLRSLNTLSETLPLSPIVLGIETKISTEAPGYCLPALAPVALSDPATGPLHILILLTENGSPFPFCLVTPYLLWIFHPNCGFLRELSQTSDHIHLHTTLSEAIIWKFFISLLIVIQHVFVWQPHWCLSASEP